MDGDFAKSIFKMVISRSTLFAMVENQISHTILHDRHTIWLSVLYASDVVHKKAGQSRRRRNKRLKVWLLYVRSQGRSFSIIWDSYMHKKKQNLGKSLISTTNAPFGSILCIHRQKLNMMHLSLLCSNFALQELM